MKQNVPYGKKDLFFCYRFTAPLHSPTHRLPGRIIVLFLDKGTIDFRINGRVCNLHTGQVLFLHPHLELQEVHASDDAEGRCIAFMMGLQDSDMNQLGPAFFGIIIAQPCWDVSPEFMSMMNAFYTMFEYNCVHPESTSSADVAASLFTVFLHFFYDCKRDEMNIGDNQFSLAQKSVMGRFANLLHVHFKEHHQVLFYADAICISPKYLTQIVKTTTGYTPKELIDRKLAVEALFMLAKTNFTIQEIAFKLGFPDQSYFGRFFKRIFAMSPLKYRANPDLSLMSRLDLDRIIE